MSKLGSIVFAVNTNQDLWERLLGGIVMTVAFGLVGIALAIVGFLVFDLLCRRIDIQRELAEKHNIPVAIVSAAVILGICFLIAHVVR